MTDPIGRVAMISGNSVAHRPNTTTFARRAAADRVFIYWAVSSCLLVFLALILALVVSGKLRAMTAAVDRQSGEIESLAARVRVLEQSALATSRPAVDRLPPDVP